MQVTRAELDAIERSTDLVAVVREQGIALRRRCRYLLWAAFVSC
jgi:hypothetical protein